MNGGLTLLRESLPSIKPSEKNAASYILAHPAEVVTLSVQELAVKSGSSEAAVIRLCKSIGVTGYRELKLKIAGDLQNESVSKEAFDEIEPNDTVEHLIEAMAEKHIQSIDQTMQVNDAKALERAVTMISRARKIDFYGVGASYLVAQDGEQKFGRIGKWCTAYSDAHQQLASAANLTFGDVAFAISYSGETGQLLQVLQRARDAGATTIVMTKLGPNWLQQLADIQLFTVAKEARIRSAATSSRIVQMYLMDIIYTAVAGRDYEHTIEALEKSRQAIQQAFQTEQK
ncbi:MurR/RpiR family transcriptional regulator [Terribacillus sp. 7520-G]|uniref:MurR/RpiR family transcriptional regulator n=1 Tax=Terribacillus sp. 7520-G TaxID=2025389 RepID=UPI000BA55221|nr:MurR/RpiR family transcriptional regulator [Terribacillus sp. 7520-G]PAD37929.1 RpiR family transcriptional regulator [Terribacillus sp. 7520-G]